MKKVLLAFAILGFVACNNEVEEKQTTDTSAVAPATVDTTAPAAVDTTKHDTTAPVKADTTKK